LLTVQAKKPSSAPRPNFEKRELIWIPLNAQFAINILRMEDILFLQCKDAEIFCFGEAKSMPSYTLSFF
jgi:hypothetical protein